MRNLKVVKFLSPFPYFFRGILLLAILLLLLAGCSSPSASDAQCSQDEARIVLGRSIDCVEIGDSADEVIQKLGEPSHFIYPDFAGEIYVYAEGNLEMIIVTISHVSPLGVIQLRVYHPYSGKTEEGAGIGTPRSEVNLLDVYLFDDNRFIVYYRADTIYSISMGIPPRN